MSVAAVPIEVIDLLKILLAAGLHGAPLGPHDFLFYFHR